MAMNLATKLLGSAAVAVLVACGGTQTGVTESTGGTDTASNPCTGTTDAAATAETPANPCVGDSTVKSLGKAFDATVLAGDGTHIQLSSAWASTTAVIVFYRGHWCPFCQRQLGELEKNRVEFEKLNANLLAVSADPEDIGKMQKNTGVSFELYADPDLVAIKAFDVLDEPNGISKPAVIIVDTKANVRFKYVGENASDRVLLKVLLAELTKIQQEEGKI